MRKRLMLVGVGVVMAICLGAAASASAATQVGDPCVANVAQMDPALTVFPFIEPQSPFPAAVPTAGVITSWGVNVGSALASGVSSSVTFKVLQPDLSSKSVKVVGESSATVTTGSNSFNVHIPVQAGDLIGTVDSSGSLLGCAEASPGEVFGVVEGNPATGATVPFKEDPDDQAQIPVFAAVEPDADGDGYGDQTQDQCPTDASTQGPCASKAAPAPMPTSSTPPPATLSASAAAKKTFLTVSLTTTAQASVTVTGTVKIGKGKSVKLRGNTQTVAPGTLAKFTVLFPAKLKAALEKLPTGKKLTITLSATAPGATTKTLTVKVPGQLKAAKKQHVK